MVWIPDKDKLTETVSVDGEEYPAWIVRRAEKLAERANAPLEDALEVVIKVVEGERNAKYGDPDEPILPSAFFTSTKSD